ncbi:HD domain-containing protein [Rufibacter roseus]|uniref:Metal-dependent HD superfamily phosphohydrolase n=1 Tax=Rufibacter roseus TaxID=1567108 RepID=A0ABW2DML5_9BACT|nr:hypothetical protein [Rufibacter roseus]
MKISLQQTWHQLAAHFSSDKALIHHLWNELETAYSATSRHYHTLQHLQNMLQLAQEHEASMQRPLLVQFAIFYHDVVYKASRTDNEEKSAEFAGLRLLQLGLSEEQVQQVQEMILATKKHEVHSNPDVNLLLDLDLSILAKDWEAYQQYCGQIRKEYRLYPDFLYLPGREKVLLHFLGQEQIFKTPLFRDLWEEKARNNLQKELETLI